VICERGSFLKPPSHSLRLTRPGGVIGRLDLWDADDSDPRALARLDEVLPTCALALENVCLRHALAADRSNDDRERLLSIIQSSSDIMLLTQADGKILFVNEAGRSALGFSDDSVHDSARLFDLMKPDDAERLRAEVVPSLRNQQRWRGKIQLQRLDDGRVIPAEITLAHVSGWRGRDADCIAVICHDRSRAESAEQELRESEDHLRQSQKMEAIGRLAGGVAHDFNNLLTAIIGYCDLLLDELDPGHAGREDAEEILKAADRASTLTRQLLAFSRRQVLQPKVLDLNALIADLDRMLQRLIGEDIELRPLFQTELAQVKADPGQLEQVLMNLVVNARDAMPRGGQITLETDIVEIDDRPGKADEAIGPGSWVRLTVSDTGAGMDSDTLSRIFDPFFTTKPLGEGTGLGLATVIGIISQSGGQIRAASQPGHGATFTIHLPRVEAEDPRLDEAVNSPDLRGTETILLVEDADPVRQLVERHLRRHGYTVLEANSSETALLHSEQHPDAIDLLLTDVILPGMDGREISQRVHERRPDVRTIYMSGFSDDSLSKHGILSRDVVLIEKPFATATLLATIRSVLDPPTPPSS
jgi:PAS domain S-box-containing protein